MSNKPNVNIRTNPLIQQSSRLYPDKDQTGDVTFIVDSQPIRAHRCVLAAYSPKYKTQFYGLQPDKDAVDVVDISAPAFEEFLQFFYLEKVTLTPDNIDMVLSLVKQSLVEEFTDECIKYLLEAMTLENLCFSYQLATLHDIEALKNLCEIHITSNANLLFHTTDFIDCDRQILINILKLDSLNCSEVEIFHACISWARAACERNGKSTTGVTNLRSELGDVINEIRFLSMSVEEFALLHKTFEGFFTPQETVDIFYIIAQLKNHKSKQFKQTFR